MMSSSSNKKKVHYTSSTKGKSSHSKESKRSSRDSGVGSSSASDRASLGTNDSPYNSQEIQYQRHNPSALSEALDAANDVIRELREANAQLTYELKESNTEKRSLRAEKHDLLKEVELLGQELKEEKRSHDKLRREVAPKTITANSSSQRRTTPPSPSSTHRPRHDDRSSQSSGSHHEESSRRYIVPQPPPNKAPNPFIPLAERTSAPSGVTYAPPTTITYSPTAAAYSAAPTFAARPAGSRASGSSSYQTSNDGNYHPYPV